MIIQIEISLQKETIINHYQFVSLGNDFVVLYANLHEYAFVHFFVSVGKLGQIAFNMLELYGFKLFIITDTYCHVCLYMKMWHWSARAEPPVVGLMLF